MTEQNWSDTPGPFQADSELFLILQVFGSETGEKEINACTAQISDD